MRPIVETADTHHSFAEKLSMDAGDVHPNAFSAIAFAINASFDNPQSTYSKR